jgi:non-heme Fe2+,alpha-ketoglutarate-dependent halogenase
MAEDIMNPEPQAKPGDHYLSDSEIKSFHEKGFLGPFTIYPREEALKRWSKAKIEMALSKNKPHDSEVVNYDRHLDSAILTEHVCRPEIVHRLISLMGGDIQCWRTEMFPKYPGETGTGYHQVQTYQVGQTKRGQLTFTEDSSEYMNELTVWTAFSDATIQNGCMTFLPGTNKRWYYDETGQIEYNPNSEKHSFFGYDYSELQLDPNWKPEDEEITSMQMEAGQAVIFTAMCVHGSHPNISDKMRMGFAARYIRPTVQVYNGIDSLEQYGGKVSLDYWGAVQVAGRDTTGYNRLHTRNLNGLEFPVPKV